MFFSLLFPTLTHQPDHKQYTLLESDSTWPWKLSVSFPLYYWLWHKLEYYHIEELSVKTNQYHLLTALYPRTIFAVSFLTMKAALFLLHFSHLPQVYYTYCSKQDDLLTESLQFQFQFTEVQMSIYSWFISSITGLNLSILMSLIFRIVPVILSLQLWVFFFYMSTSAVRCPSLFILAES